jgi:hypothetical protein
MKNIPEVALAQQIARLCEGFDDATAMSAISIVSGVRAGKAGLLAAKVTEGRVVDAYGQCLRHVFEAWRLTGRAPWE